MYIACVDLFLLELLVNTDSMNQNIYNCRAVFFFSPLPSYPQRASAAQSQPFHSNLFSATHVPVHTV